MKISIIIPTIGRKTLPQVLQSILGARDYNPENIEIIVVGDGKFSTAGRGTARDFILGKGKFAEIIFLTTGQNLGASGARNLALDKATGEIIAFLGDDTIVDKMWITETRKFHQKNPAKNYALLGKIEWVEKFRKKPFYKWLNNHAQFAFRSIRLHGAKWNHFYTSNVSLKREFIGDERFFAGFSGWGFEDSEFAYRLYQKGMNLIYYPKVIVYHDHEQTIDDVVRNFKNARKNAKIFEKLHPELQIIPRGAKLEILKKMIKVAKFLSPVFPQAEWWYKWKEAWINGVKWQRQGESNPCCGNENPES